MPSSQYADLQLAIVISTPVNGSVPTRLANNVLYTHAGPEIAVASTKAYTSQVVLLGILAVYFAEILGSQSTESIEAFKKEEELVFEEYVPVEDSDSNQE